MQNSQSFSADEILQIDGCKRCIEILSDYEKCDKTKPLTCDVCGIVRDHHIEISIPYILEHPNKEQFEGYITRKIPLTKVINCFKEKKPLEIYL